MATSGSSESQRAFDPTKPGKYNIRLGESLSAGPASKRQFSSIAFNHKPSQTGATRTTTINSPNHSNQPYELSIEDQDDADNIQCIYSGRKRDLVDSYVLTFDHDNQCFELDALQYAYEFNMVSAPWEKDEAKLAQEYKQIDLTEHPTSPPLDGGATSGTDDEADAGAASGAESDGPKESNPFDYRHYLNGIPGTGPDSKEPSTVSTPLLGPKTGQDSPKLGSRQKDSVLRGGRQVPRGKSSQSDVNSRAHFQGRGAKSRNKAPNSGDEAGEGLIIDAGPPPPPAKKRRTAALKGQRPKSLHAAAKAAQAPQQSSPPHQEAGSGYEEDDESDGNKGANDDVEELELPAPAAERPRTLMRRQSTWEDGDEEALLGALEEAFQGEDDEEEDGGGDPPGGDEGAQHHTVASESESEEE